MKAITERLCGLEISKSQVSALAQDLDGQLEAWRRRPMDGAYPYLVVDARYEKVRRGGQVVSQGVLVVGVRADGFREILGVWQADSESETSWSAVFRELKRRGLSDVQYVVSDDHTGLRQAIERCFQGALWQRCQVHFLRNALARVRPKDRVEVIALLRRVTQADTREEARAALGRAAEQLARRYRALAAWLEEEGEDILAVYALPAPHRRRIRRTEVRRPTCSSGSTKSSSDERAWCASSPMRRCACG